MTTDKRFEVMNCKDCTKEYCDHCAGIKAVIASGEMHGIKVRR